MPSRINPTKPAAIALAALALAAPAASARIAADGPVPVAAGAQPKHDLRSPDARDAAARSQSPTSSLAGTTSKQDLRSPDARDAARPAPAPALPGPPTWPQNPQPITPATQTAPADGGDGIGTVPLLGLIVGGLALIGGAGAVAIRMRRPRASLAG